MTVIFEGTEVHTVPLQVSAHTRRSHLQPRSHTLEQIIAAAECSRPLVAHRKMLVDFDDLRMTGCGVANAARRFVNQLLHLTSQKTSQ
jgi:hypothetical protein